MRRALIGHTGFVGGNLDRQLSFEAKFNSKNIGELAGQRFDEIWCAGVPAVKWLANKDPEGDLKAIAGLMEPLLKAQCGELILLSTVDVFDPAVEVDESTPVRTEGLHPYGLHRYQVEQRLSQAFKTTVVRLPGLFGRGLKKNIVYDVLTGNAVSAVDHRAVFQFYYLEHLAADIAKARAAQLPLIHLAAEPTSVQEVLKEAFGKDFENAVAPKPARYDFRSKHAGLWGKQDYQYSKAEVLAEMKDFVRRAIPEGLLGTPK